MRHETFAVLTIVALLAGPDARAADVPMEPAPDAPAAGAPPPPAPAKPDTTMKAFWKDGLRLETSDGDFRFRIGGRIHNDWVAWDTSSELRAAVEPNGDQVEDGTEFRRARLYIAGEIYTRILFKTEYDFAQGTDAFRDAYIGVSEIPWLGTARVGYFKEPFSLEKLTSGNYTTFLERGLPDAFTPLRNTGFGFNTAFLEDRMTLGAGAFRNTDDFGDSVGDKFQFATRISGLPIAPAEDRVVHLGFSYRRNNADDDEMRFRQRPEVRLSPRFIDTGTFEADDADIYGTEAAVVLGPVSLQGEYTIADVTSSVNGDPVFDGYYVFISWFPTGEHRPYKASEGVFDRVRPERNAFKGGIGAFELAARYSTMDLDDEAISGGELDNATFGVNWYLNPSARIMANYIHADLEDVDSAEIFAMRFEIDL